MSKVNNLNGVAKLINFIVIFFIIIFLSYMLYNVNFIKKLFFVPSYFSKQYEFISPLLKYDDSRLIEQTKRPFYKEELENIVNWHLKNVSVKDISLYFRDLNNWFTFWINEREVFSPASLTKVPTMMAVLKKVSEGGLSLDDRVVVGWLDVDLYTHYIPFLKIKNHSEYSVKELLEYMIEYSDNGATFALWSLLSGQNLKYQGVYEDLKIDFSWDFVEVVDYSTLFRVLFNSSYLNKYYSDYSLRLLSQVVFDKWLRAWVPLNLKVSHKFGELVNPGGIKQLHDCGIIYFPDHPYVLCIMTRWADSYKQLEDVISSISKYIYDSMVSTYNK